MKKKVEKILDFNDKIIYCNPKEEMTFKYELLVVQQEMALAKEQYAIAHQLKLSDRGERLLTLKKLIGKVKDTETMIRVSNVFPGFHPEIVRIMVKSK